MRLRPRNNLTSSAFANIYSNKGAKGDRARSWSYAKRSKRRPGPCVNIPVDQYVATVTG